MDGGDNNPLPLPPRVADRFRELSISPQPPDNTSTPSMDTGPPKPPRRMPRSASGEHNRLSGGSQGNHFDRELPFPPPPPIVPYSVTTITPIDTDTHTSHSQQRSESPPLIMTLPIPPPPILHQPWRTDTDNESVGIYYSVPSEMSDTGMSRVLSEHGTFVDQERRTSTSHSSVDSGREGGLRPLLGEGTEAGARLHPLCLCSSEVESQKSNLLSPLLL